MSKLEKRLDALEAFVWSPQSERISLEALQQLLLEAKELRAAIAAAKAGEVS